MHLPSDIKRSISGSYHGRTIDITIAAIHLHISGIFYYAIPTVLDLLDVLIETQLNRVLVGRESSKT